MLSREATCRVIKKDLLDYSGSIQLALLLYGDRQILLLKNSYDAENKLKISFSKPQCFYSVYVMLESYEDLIVENFIDGKTKLILVFDNRYLGLKA